MRSRNAGARLLAIGLVFGVMGAVQWAWFEPKAFGQGAVTGGIVVALIGIHLMAGTGETPRSPGSEQ